jgi:hypothetical protein
VQSAVGEAAFMTGLERTHLFIVTVVIILNVGGRFIGNSDIVFAASYAPLLNVRVHVFDNIAAYQKFLYTARG